jgi:hypothetical protein
MQAHSYEILVGFKWQTVNQLLIRLDLGCDGNHSAPVETVGPIHIVYRYGDPGHTPRVGYESFRRRDLPPEACN